MAEQFLAPINLFSKPGTWYKGNLHTHTTNSDGALTPEQVVAFYRSRGYQFLCITDHRRVTPVERLSSPDLLVLPGAELDERGPGSAYHMVAVNLPSMDGYPAGGSAQDVARWASTEADLLIMAHPYWSGFLPTDLMELDGWCGIEVYNSTCAVSVGKGMALSHWDYLLWSGRKALGFATDDTHWHVNDHRPPDAGIASVYVKAESLDARAICHALKTGAFYASTGARIESIQVSDGVLRVVAPGSSCITVVAERHKGERFVVPSGGLLDDATYRLRGDEQYLRVEVAAPDGGMAWSNPIWPPFA